LDNFHVRAGFLDFVKPAKANSFVQLCNKGTAGTFASAVPRSGGTYHVNGTERTADAGSPSRGARGSVESRSQCIKRGGERGSQLDFVPENCALGGGKVAVPLSCPYFTEPGRVG